MPNDAPLELDIIGELTDAAIEALAVLLCDLAEAEQNKEASE